MQAETFDQCYDIEGAVESALKSFFTSQEIAAYTTNDIAELQKTRPRVEVVLQLGNENGHNSAIAPYYRPDTFSASLLIGVVTNAKDDNTGTVEHAQFRARVRNAMAKARTLLKADADGDDTLLPYHGILDIVESGTSPAYEPQDGHYISRINYSLIINIRPDAWPAE